MGILGAMATAVSGLRVQSYALENISGNIANSQTTGFKRVDTSFVDLIPDLPAGRELAGSVSAQSRLTNTVAGNLQPTGIATNMALSGEGFFVVQNPSGNGNLYTRRGDFTQDKDGHLVNGAGYLLKGTLLDPTTGTAIGSGNDLVQISTQPIAASKTTEVVYRANLPSAPATPAAVAAGTSATTADRLLPASVNLAAPVPGTAAFTDHSISGGTLTVYDALGAPSDVQLRWAKTDDASLGGAHKDSWALLYRSDSSGNGTWQQAGTNVDFDVNGRITAPASNKLSIASLVIDGKTIGPVDVTFNDSNGVTQFADSDGLVKPSLVTQNGYPQGTLESLSVTSDGHITGSYSNGRVISLAQVSVAQFNADDALKRLDGGVYQETLESGLPIISQNGTTIVGANVEGSNTDIADEFSKIIVTQQAYSANTRVVSTSQQMLTDVLNIIR